MHVFLVFIHLLVVFMLVCLILLQSSDGNAFGASSNFMSTRGSANPLARITAILACLFFVTCMALGIVSRYTSMNRKEELRQAMADSTIKTDNSSSIRSSSKSQKKSSRPSPAAK
ncbi:MAG: preprotein translocase subunit SecG [Candidatus Liberibacter ctenarytainae]|uniref:Protein-export membrane protein SecG n=1 Tax=Candidatus Liberibacter ctenarytainae TaxID=2020335 RepID=A0A937DLD4_9HYPH|nr:preprotein translocase subunit SecG [Candidatus Liberibacter ctenarytainae]